MKKATMKSLALLSGILVGIAAGSGAALAGSSGHSGYGQHQGSYGKSYRGYGYKTHGGYSQSYRRGYGHSSHGRGYGYGHGKHQYYSGYYRTPYVQRYRPYYGYYLGNRPGYGYGHGSRH